MKRHDVVLIAAAMFVLSGHHATAARSVAPATSSAVGASTALNALALFMNAPTVEGLGISAEGSPAYVYLDSVRLIAANDALGLFARTETLTVQGDALVGSDGFALDNLVFDDQGRMVDLSRAGRPVSETVFPLYQVVEGVDEGSGVTGTIHSVRYFDGNLQFVTLTENHSNVEAYIAVDEYVSAGRQITNVFGNPIRPTIVNASVDVFEGVPEEGGTGYGHIWADNIGVTEFQVTVPPTSPAPPVPSTAPQVAAQPLVL